MTALSNQIHEEIRLRGPISFARFMELALYAPGVGYYERRREIGRSGDFFTSVSVGPLFGQLLAFQFAQWADADCPDGGIQYIEAGPHNGALAADVLDWTCRHRTDLYERLHYILLDASPIRCAWQEETLQPWLSHIKWAPDLAALAASQTRGIVFSNEFLDALPVHRLAWNRATRQWQEGFVTTKGDKFVWTWGAPEAALAPRIPAVPGELAEVLPDGFMVEICPVATAWWRTAAAVLAQGKLLAIDYGVGPGEQFLAHRKEGTLRAFSHHHASVDLLSQPGEQDLTAHVNFPALIEAGQAAGLRTEGLVRQSKFLTEIFASTRRDEKSFDAWDEQRIRQFKTLSHPEHLGHQFQFLLQAR